MAVQIEYTKNDVTLTNTRVNNMYIFGVSRFTINVLSSRVEVYDLAPCMQTNAPVVLSEKNKIYFISITESIPELIDINGIKYEYDVSNSTASKLCFNIPT